MAFRVEAVPEAKQDAREILAWLRTEHAGETGLQWFEGLTQAASSLKVFPKRCPLAPENAGVSFEMRQLLYGKPRHRYRILFTVSGDTVLILRIRRPGQQLLLPYKETSPEE